MLFFYTYPFNSPQIQRRRHFYQGREKADPAWGGGNHKKEVRGLWIISIMIVISALFGIYDFRLGGVVGFIEGAAFSWFCCSMPLPVLS